MKSRPSTADGKFSGVDRWKINLSTLPGYVGMDVREESGTGIAMGYDVTFIQQFNSQKESLLRIPYDPITKLPFTADVFDKEITVNGQKQLLIKEGDFIAMRVPMVLSLGASFSKAISAILKIDASLAYAISSEFDVHLFRLPNNRVRVKL